MKLSWGAARCNEEMRGGWGDGGGDLN